VAALHGKLYAFGGFTDIVHLDPRPVAYAYDPRRDSWDRLPDVPQALGSVGVAAVGGELHLLGGRDSRTVAPVPGTPISQGLGTVRTHLVYDPQRRRWSTAEPLPGEPRDHAGIAVLGRSIHVVGGRVEDVADNLARHDVYDTRTGRWTTAAALPVPRSAGAAVVLDGRIVYAGGECRSPGAADPSGTYDDVTAYDPRTDRWTALAPLPQGRHGFGAARVGGRAHFVAGAPTCGGGASAENLELDLARHRR
jgi:N-acetylneuraminic acid mutarotase